MSKFFRHWGMVNRHRFRVFVNGCHCGIGFHCLFHDISKFSFKEFFRSVRYYDGTHSPVLEERMAHDGFSYICQHHTKRNKHHWEYWTDFYRGKIVAMAMPWLYATEYVCDMLSASYCYDPKGFTPGKTLDYFSQRLGRYYISDVTREYVLWCLTRFRDMGFAGLKKRDTKKAYEDIKSRFPLVRTFAVAPIEGALPQRESETIMPTTSQGGKP